MLKIILWGDLWGASASSSVIQRKDLGYKPEEIGIVLKRWFWVTLSSCSFSLKLLVYR